MFSRKNTSKPLLVHQESEGESEYEGGLRYNMQAQINDPYQGALTPRTHLTQIYTSNVEESPRLIQQDAGNQVPIACVFIKPSCVTCCPCTWCTCCKNIPTGMLVLEQHWGKDSGLMEDGLHCCYSRCRRPVVAISREEIRFNCPISDVVTKDNVHVSVDMGVNFHIGRSPETFQDDAKKFFYNFGPNRLGELLGEDMDEEIRGFVRQFKARNVRDIKTELTIEMQRLLYAKFLPYGVVIDQVNCMNIVLPKDLREYLQHTTNYDVYLQKQVKQQENKMLRLNNLQNEIHLQLKRDNFQVLMSKQNEIILENIHQHQAEIEMETKRELQIIAANKRKNVRIINAENIKHLAYTRAQGEATIILAEAEAYKQRAEIWADLEEKRIKASTTRLIIAQSKCPAMIKESQADEDCQEKLKGLREFDENMSLANSLLRTARTQKIVVAGEQGKLMLDFFNDTLNSCGNVGSSAQNEE